MFPTLRPGGGGGGQRQTRVDTRAETHTLPSHLTHDGQPNPPGEDPVSALAGTGCQPLQAPPTSPTPWATCPQHTAARDVESKKRPLRENDSRLVGQTAAEDSARIRGTHHVRGDMEKRRHGDTEAA